MLITLFLMQSHFDSLLQDSILSYVASSNAQFPLFHLDFAPYPINKQPSMAEGSVVNRQTDRPTNHYFHIFHFNLIASQSTVT